MWFVYIVETEQGKLYTGITTDVNRRYQEHMDVALKKPKAKGAKFFRSQTPKSIVFSLALENRSEATKLETKIKKLSLAQKKGLIAGSICATSL